MAWNRETAARRRAQRIATGDLCSEQDCPRPRAARGLCKTCYNRKCQPDRHKNTERDKARQRAKTHKRKTVGRHTDITLEYEQQLRRKAKRCPLCQVRMTSNPYLPTSKELDHIVPLNAGGTHTVGNVRIICRDCNMHRPRDGSDYTGPVTLWACAPGFIPPQGTGGQRGYCECGTKKVNSRCWSCSPAKPKIRNATVGRRAAELRAEGWAWKDIALATGFANTGSCHGAAQAYGLPEVQARWPARYVNAIKPAPTPARQPAQRSTPTVIAPVVPRPVRTPARVPPTPVVCVDCTDPVARGSIRCSECLIEIEESCTESHKPLAATS